MSFELFGARSLTGSIEYLPDTIGSDKKDVAIVKNDRGTFLLSRLGNDSQGQPGATKFDDILPTCAKLFRTKRFS